MGSMRLSAYMDEFGLSDAKMAARMGYCGKSAVRKWRLGQRIPTPRFMVLIRDTTGGCVTANDFMLSSKVAAE